MPPDAVRLRQELAQHLDTLHRLEVVEAAEDVVRDHQLQLLGAELAGLRDELTRAQQHLSSARAGRELSVIFEAEEHVCGVLRQTTVVQRQTREHIRASTAAHRTYLAQRDRIVERVDQLRRLLLYRRGGSAPG
jgi:hypothetical protein